MARSKSTYKIGSQVRIINPVFFERCGYPISIEMEIESIKKEHGNQICDFIRSLTKSPVEIADMKALDFRGVNPQTFDKIIMAIAYDSLKAKKFGGRTRSVHTKARPEYLNQTAHISRMFRCKTGEYVPGHSYSTMDGYEYDPPYLGNEKTHCIFELDRIHRVEIEPLKIESVNVELVTQ